MILPKISVVIPSYNQKEFLSSALQSIDDQKYPDLEVIVVDGGSNDGTVELLSSKSSIRWVSEKDNGQTDALNKGFRMATGDVFGWLNCDEKYLNGTLNLTGELFASNPGLDIVFGNRIVVNEYGEEIARDKSVPLHPFKYALYSAGLLFSDATFWSSELHRKTGELDTVICGRYGMDYDWFFRMSIYVKRWKYVDRYLSEFTEYPGRMSKNVSEMPDIALAIRNKIIRMTGVNKLSVMIKAPFYLAFSRYKRLGIKGLFHIPEFKSILRTAGILK